MRQTERSKRLTEKRTPEKLRHRGRYDHPQRYRFDDRNVKSQTTGAGIGVLRQEAAARDETIEILQTKIRTIQTDHSWELTVMQAQHTTETANLTKRYEKEMSLLKTALSKAVTWFPYFREMIRMESVCRTVGFDDEQTATLINGKPLEYSGELYSEEHNCKFTFERVIAQITPDPIDKRKLQLNIGKVPFKEWSREKFEKLRRTFQYPTRSQRNHKYG